MVACTFPEMALAMLLVRNPVSHDARVLRAAGVLRELGYEIEILGVVSAAGDRRDELIAGFPVVRLAPSFGALGRLRGLRRRRRSVEAGRGAGVPAPQRRPAAARRFALRRIPMRLIVTARFYAQAIVHIVRRGPALVHANDYNTMWVGVAAKLLRGSRLVYDSHELWADRNGRPEWRPWLLLCEALFVRIADVTITASPGYADALAARYRVPPPQVVRNIPQAPAPAPSAVPDSAQEAAGAATVAVYVGGLMPGRGLEQAIDALSLAPEVRLRLIGPGHAAYRDGLRHRAEQAGVLDRIELLDPVAPDAVVGALAGAHVGLMLIQPICRSYELTLPNKLFEYAAAGIPVLASDLSVMGPLIRAEGLGEAVAPADIVAIAQAMQRLGDPRVAVSVRGHVRQFAATHTWERERIVLLRCYAP